MVTILYGQSNFVYKELGLKQPAWIQLIMITRESHSDSIKPIKQSLDGGCNWNAKNWEHQLENTAEKNLSGIFQDFPECGYHDTKRRPSKPIFFAATSW